MFTSERLIRYRLTQWVADDPNGPTDDDIDRATDVALWVERHMFCPFTGDLLDSRTAQKLTVLVDGEPTSWFAVSPDLTPSTPSVVEGLERLRALVDGPVSADLWSPVEVWSAVEGKGVRS